MMITTRQITKRKSAAFSIVGAPIIFWMFSFWLISQGFLLSFIDWTRSKDLNYVNRPVVQERTMKQLKKTNLDAPVFEIAIPFCGKSTALFDFTERLGHSLSTLKSNVQMRLLVTKCTDDDDLFNNKYLEFLEEKAGGIPIKTIPLSIKGSEFSRGLSLNALTERACSDPGCYFSVVDVDLAIKPSFIENVISYVKTNQTIYYPIVFSEYETSSVLAAETIFGELGPYNEHRGRWRKSGYGLYAMLGEAVASLKVESRLESKWGGEDVELKKRAENRGFSIVREHEQGLVHKWHPKLCTSEFVDPSFLDRCLYARDTYSGSAFIQRIRANNETFFDNLVFMPKGPKRPYLAGTTWAALEYKEFTKKELTDKVPIVGDMVSFFYDRRYGYQLARVIDEKEQEGSLRLRLNFLIDNTLQWNHYDPRKFNHHSTASFENCIESLHPDSPLVNEPAATVSCRRVHFKAPSEVAFKKAGKLIVGVLSSATNRVRRNLIRETWASRERGGIFYIVSGPFEEIEEEYREHQDLIWIEGEEDFGLITYKTAMFVKIVNTMASDLRLNYTHALKTDDDSYVATERLTSYLEEREDIEYWGSCGTYVKPYRDPKHKYYISEEEYSEAYFPPYCQGGGFVLSRAMVECAANQMEKTKFLSMEDTYMGMLSERCGIFPSQAPDDRLKIYRGNHPTDKEVRSATMENKFLQHHIVSDEDMKDYHDAMIKEINTKIS